MISDLETLCDHRKRLHAVVDQLYFMERPEGESSEQLINSMASKLNSEMQKIEGAQEVLTMIKQQVNINTEPYQK